MNDLKFKNKKFSKVREGFPISILISAKVFCPWYKCCKGFVQSIYEPSICINYEPKNIDFKNVSLKCINFKKSKGVMNVRIK